MSTLVSAQPWYVGMDYPVWQIPLNTDEGPDDITTLSASNISLYFRNTTVTPPVDTIGTGTITILSADPAVIFYKPSTTDVASTFTGAIVIRAKFGPSFGTADTTVYDPVPFSISY